MNLDYWRNCTRFIAELRTRGLITTEHQEEVWLDLVFASTSDAEARGILATKKLAETYPEVFAALRVKRKLLGKK